MSGLVCNFPSQIPDRLCYGEGILWKMSVEPELECIFAKWLFGGKKCLHA